MVVRIGVLCPAEIAYRRFMPALTELEDVEFVGVGVNSLEERFGVHDTYANEQIQRIEYGKSKAQKFVDEYGGQVFESYQKVLECKIIDAVYIPLPPALHYKWAKKALKMDKNVLLEKPSTPSFTESLELVELAQKRDLALQENYMFLYHKQLSEIDQILSSGEIGEFRLARISFGFPMRAQDDFRYSKELGGGALLDAGGYTLRYATYLLGDTAYVTCSHLNYLPGFDVDMYGSGEVMNERGDVVQISFGMDNNYKCELEIWGSKGSIYTGRILTAPKGYVPNVVIRKENEETKRELSEDDTFKNSINRFAESIRNKEIRDENYKQIIAQATILDEFKRKAVR